MTYYSIFYNKLLCPPSKCFELHSALEYESKTIGYQ